MSAGDIYNQGVTAVAAGGYFSMQPAAGVECVIHNINRSGAGTLEYYDGTTAIPVDAQTVAGGWRGQFHCTNSKYYRVHNTSSSANNIGCDGVVTKAA